MSIALDDALLSWLVASAGGRLLRRLRGNPTQVALRTVVEEAVKAAVAKVAAHLDGEQTEHLRSSLLVRYAGPDGGQPPSVSTEAELRDAVRAWTAALDEAPFGGPGYLTGLGVDAERLAGALADHIVVGIYDDARDGGVLDGRAGWLWRDAVIAWLARIEEKIDAAVPAEPVGKGLPGGTPYFTGRQEMLDELARRVQEHDPDETVVAIHPVDGMAGVGKTELALRAAHQHKNLYPDGQYFLDLHGYTEGIAAMQPTAALEELLRQAGVPGPEIPADLASRQARWRSLMATRQALVLLDNALDTVQVRPLLPGSAGCLVLITSRTRLRGLPGAKPLRLDVLPHADAVALFARLVATARRLDPQAVATVVELVGRLPVAVQAVAGLVDDRYTEADLADELADVKGGLGLLDQVSPLDAGVRAAFETSLRRLDQAHREAFLMLGVHPGPIVGAPQFAALAGKPVASARAMLRELADRNLIFASDRRRGHHRYQLHDLVRAFAHKQSTMHLTEQDQTAAIDRLTTWYATAMAAIRSLLGASTPDPAGSGVEGLDLDSMSTAWLWITAEQDNLLAYAKVATGTVAADVCQRAAYNLYYCRAHTTAQMLIDTAGTLYRQAGDRAGEAVARRRLGCFALRLAGHPEDYQDAAGYLRTAHTIFAEIGGRAGQAEALVGLGLAAVKQGRPDEARERWEDALRIVEEIGDPRAASARDLLARLGRA